MPTDLFKVHDFLKWGRLVKAWALKTPFPGTGGPPLVPPTTLAELKAQCAAIGLRIDVPSYLEHVRVLEGVKNTITIRLPAPELVRAIEQDFDDPAQTYALPPFYDQLYGHPLPPPPLTKPQKLDLQAERIGDYAVGMCQ